MSDFVNTNDKAPLGTTINEASHSEAPVPCEKIQEVLFDYLAHELNNDMSWLVHEHLRGCKACASEAARLAKTMDILKASPAPSTLEHLKPTIRKRLQRALLHPLLEWIYVHRRLVAWSTALLITALILIIAYYYRTQPEFTIYWLK